MFNQNSYLVKFWYEKEKQGYTVPNLFNLIEEVEKYRISKEEPIIEE